MFLLVVGHGVGNRMIQERFQHSRETVSRRFHDVLVAYLSLSIEYIKPQGCNCILILCHYGWLNFQYYE